jgi:hypothetical protein
MIVEAQVLIAGTKAAVWGAITDIEGAPNFISGIRRIEIVERPAGGLRGLRWRETRLLYGEPATVEKVVTEVSPSDFYETTAESDGFVFVTTTRISGPDGAVTLTSRHDSQPQSMARKLISMPMLFLFKGVVRKAIMKDLNDIKFADEQKA